MTYVDRIRLAALDLCMSTGLRYLECLNICFHFEMKKYRSITGDGFKIAMEDLMLASEEHKVLKREFKDYMFKMKEAGLK